MKGLWQYTFLAGMVASIITAVFVFGYSLFTAVITVSAIILAILNVLLGSGVPGALSGYSHKV